MPDSIRPVPATAFAAAVAALSLSSCHSISPAIATGPAAHATTGLANPSLVPGVYVIGPADVLNVAVAYEPELTAQSVVVDSNGEISLPLTGTVRAAGKTSSSLAQDVAARLGTYLRDPRVTVNIVRFARQAVTVEGSVIAPGIYDLPVSSSLLRTLALAKGPTNTARLNEVIVFRNINGQRMGAVFDLRRIRRGFEPDPLILGGDIVVVGYDDLKGAFRDFVAISPALSVFRRY